MKKGLLALPMVFVASWAGAAYYTGAQTQSAYDEFLSSMNETHSLVLVKERYTSGVLNSTAITKVMDSEAEDAEILFRMKHDIEHSPIGIGSAGVRVSPAKIVTTLVQDELIDADVQNLLNGFSDQEPFLVSTVVHFDGAVSSQIEVASFDMEEDDLRLQFDGANYTVSAVEDSMVVTGSIGELSLTRSTDQLLLTPGEIIARLKLVENGVFTGNYSIQFDKLDFLQYEEQRFQLSDLGFSMDASVENEMFDNRFEFFVNQIDAALPLESASLAYGVSDVPLESLDTFTDLLREIPAWQADDQAASEELKRMLSAVATLAQPGAGIDMEFKLKNEGGQAGVTYGIEVVDSDSSLFPVGGVAAAKTVGDLVGALKVDYSLNADVSAIEQTPLAAMMTAPMVQQYVVSDGKSYKMEVSVADLVVNINGSPLSLELLFPDQLNMPVSSVLEL